MSIKTPFEIRADLLALAKDYFDQIQRAHFDFASKAFAKAIEEGTAMSTDWSSYMPKSYSIEDVMKKAAEMYTFVSDTSTPKKN